MPGRGPALAGAQLGRLDGRDDRPVLADGTALQAPPEEARRLHRHARDPQRREEMALTAAHHEPAADREPAQPHRDRLGEEQPEEETTAASGPHLHMMPRLARWASAGRGVRWRA